LPLGRCRRQKRLVKRFSDDARHLRDSISGLRIKGHDDFGESAYRSAKIQTPALNFELSTKKFFSDKCVKGGL
jgi:hypothetical protein